ncbi:MAG: ABC transporter permease [Burkholderiaceae bacterium]|nr:ABC transporter permease [Burkholderiaceae bacterium]
MLLLAVGVATITLVILVSDELEQRMQREAAGIDLVVGAKGSPLSIVLAGVYHVDVPPGNIPLTAVRELASNPLVREVIPLALGDSIRGYRIVGTTDALVAHYGAALSAGRLWQAPMEAVLGSDVARGAGLAEGGTFAGSHGLAEGGGEHGEATYRVGVLAPTGTVVDRLVLTGIDSVWAVHEAHGHGEAHDEDAADDEASASEREVTLALVKYRSPLAAASLPRAINEETVLQAAAPAYESARLFSVFGVGTGVVRGFALLLIGASALGLFVALTQALDERRRDLAIMRTLGASRARIVGVLLLESVGLTALALAIGLLAAHAVAASLGTWLPEAAPLAAGAARWRAGEGWVVILALGAGIMAAALPAWRAYRLDVAAILSEG